MIAPRRRINGFSAAHSGSMSALVSPAAAGIALPDADLEQAVEDHGANVVAFAECAAHVVDNVRMIMDELGEAAA